MSLGQLMSLSQLMIWCYIWSFLLLIFNPHRIGVFTRSLPGSKGTTRNPPNPRTPLRRSLPGVAGHCIMILAWEIPFWMIQWGQRYIHAINIYLLIINNWWFCGPHPFETISSNWIISPGRVENNFFLSCHHLDTYKYTFSIETWPAPTPGLLSRYPWRHGWGLSWVSVKRYRETLLLVASHK